MDNRYYVYAIVAADHCLTSRIDGAELSLVRCGDLAAVVEPVTADRMRATAPNVLRHEAVVEALRRSMPLLPVRFGTVLPDVDAIVRSLDERYSLLAADLTRLGETFEFGLIVRWRPDAAVETEEPDQADADLVRAASEAGDGRRYLQARVAEHQRERTWRM
jgi:hypothetical protein